MAHVGKSLAVEGVVKRYGKVAALDDVTFDFGASEFITLLGPSGSGKTTLLMVLAGFTQLDAGSVLLDGVRIENIPPSAATSAWSFRGTLSSRISPSRKTSPFRCECAHCRLPTSTRGFAPFWA